MGKYLFTLINYNLLFCKGLYTSQQLFSTQDMPPVKYTNLLLMITPSLKAYNSLKQFIMISLNSYLGGLNNIRKSIKI